MAVASFNIITHPATLQKWFRNGLRNTTTSRCWLGLQITQISVQSIRFAGPTNQIRGGQTSDLICFLVLDTTAHPQVLWSPCLDGSELFKQQKGDLHKISQLFIIMGIWCISFSKRRESNCWCWWPKLVSLSGLLDWDVEQGEDGHSVTTRSRISRITVLLLWNESVGVVWS